ncbi:MAG: hypothetical protein M0T80_13795 [Actinomycetota bacterium]|nr:hypothetical protein [Actinomycetota bacterium]
MGSSEAFDARGVHKMAHTVCADTGVPSIETRSAMSVTERSSARSARTWSRTRRLLRGPLGPGLEETKNWVRPARSSAASWCTVAAEYPKRAPTSAALASSTK